MFNNGSPKQEKKVCIYICNFGENFINIKHLWHMFFK